MNTVSLYSRVEFPRKRTGGKDLSDFLGSTAGKTDRVARREMGREQARVWYQPGPTEDDFDSVLLAGLWKDSNVHSECLDEGGQVWNI